MHSLVTLHFLRQFLNFLKLFFHSSLKSESSLFVRSETLCVHTCTVFSCCVYLFRTASVVLTELAFSMLLKVSKTESLPCEACISENLSLGQVRAIVIF